MKGRKGEKDGKDGNYNLFELRETREVSKGVSDGESEDELSVQGMQRGSGGRKEGGSREQAREKASSRRIKRKVFRCDICGLNFQLDEDVKKKNTCYQCYHAMRDAEIICPICKNKYPIRRMNKVKVYLKPGKKGGKVHNVYYCFGCYSRYKAMVKRMERKQVDQLDQIKAEQRRMMRSMYKGNM